MMMKEERFDNPIYSSCNGPMGFTEVDRESLPTPCNRTHLSGSTSLRRHHILLLCVVVVGCTVAVISLFAQKHNKIAQRQRPNNETCLAEREEIKTLKSENYRVLLNMILKQEGWKHINSSLYYISTEMKSWDESRPYCQRKGLDLVTINSEEEQAFLLEVVSAKKLEGVWIDLSPSNTKETSTRVKRGAGSKGGQEEDCAKLTVYETPAVKEVTGRQCGTQKYCICEKHLMSNTM
ncbi:C-type lectin domain family 4 member F-like [Salvelinus namaycush]|uniref:C-type lectin domain family 4 member F-like n=1 Tax=Salvelinus namaycush TaxID=8040 RepID=A0A8U0Q869_SALNM|nr:C-type lectin domain family 4 member F-like [Salvelinus namaycush]